MLGAIEDQCPTINTHGCNDIWILWLISGLVDLSRMINPLVDGHLDASSFSIRVSITSNFFALLIVVVGIGGDIVWKLDGCDFQVVWLVVGGVCADEKAMDTVILSSRPMAS